MPMQMRLTFASELLRPLLEFALDDFIRPIFERMVPDAALWFARAGRPPARRRMDANRQPGHRDGSGNHGRGGMRAPRRTCHPNAAGWKCRCRNFTLRSKAPW